MKKLALFLALPLCLLLGGFSIAQNIKEPEICYAEISPTEEANVFIDYWKNDVRGKYPDICSMSKEKYQEVYIKYVSLSSFAKAIVDSTIDVGNYTIKDTMTTLINKFADKGNTSQTATFDKNTTLTIIIVVGVIGMTSICGLYLLKTKKVIQ